MILRGTGARGAAGGSSSGGGSGGSGGGRDSGSGSDSGSDDDSGEGASGGRVLRFDPQARKRRDKDGGEKGGKSRGATLPRRVGAQALSDGSNRAAAGGGEGAFNGSGNSAGYRPSTGRRPGVSPASMRGAHSFRFKVYRVLQVLGLVAVLVIYLRSCGQL